MTSDEFTSPVEIAELNIRHYQQLLQTSLDEQRRMTVEKLLAEERIKLANLLQRPRSCAGGTG